MDMPDVGRRWTREEVLALPDDGIATNSSTASCS